MPKAKDTGFEKCAWASRAHARGDGAVRPVRAGHTVLRFSGLEAQRPVDSATFHFVPPKGADVIEDAAPSAEAREASAADTLRTMNQPGDLLHRDRGRDAPLAERLRPRRSNRWSSASAICWAKASRCAWPSASGKPHSMILWGPPGVGKTTLARLMAHAFDAEFIALSAVLSGVKDIRDAVGARTSCRSRAVRPRTPSCSWTRCTASTRRSRTLSCPSSSRACSPSSARPPRIRRSR